MLKQFFRAGFLLALVLPVGFGSAAILHRPLPRLSLARNGTPKPMQSHTGPRVPPHALPGLHFVKSPGEALKRHYGGTPIDVLTYHYDQGRTGWNPSETDLTPASVSSGNFGQIATLDVDGNVLAQPLLVSGFKMPDGSTHDVLIVVTGNNSVYAFDADNYSILWKVNLGAAQLSTDVGCGDVVPEYGISSTPVIVRNGPGSATLYLVAATEPNYLSFHTQLHALDLGTGADIVTPVEIAPQAKLKSGGTISFDPQNQWSRAGLAFNNGNLYVSIGSHCDNNADAVSGWLLQYDSATLKLEHHFHTISTSWPQYELAGIWGAGFAPAIDASGNVFVVTGNGAFAKKTGDWAESVLRLPFNLKKVADHFTVSDYPKLNKHDRDFGSGGVMLVPVVQGQTAPPMAVAMGKDAVLYLLNQTNLGGFHKNDAGALQAQRLAKSGQGLWGGPAYYGGPNGGMVYVQTNGDVLRAFSLATGQQPALTQVATGNQIAGYGGSLPIVSSNGSEADTAIVWVVQRGTTVALQAYDAVNLGQPLFAANAGTWSNSHGNSFLTAMEGNGRVYVPASGTVTVFGLQ